ncbi:Zn-dependent protease with chaperone function [Nonomuraea thailandensis]|uniref:Zn-dependent protease with chaperone function n=1 Tax=Nonomuraea thailandensis TaxID=1188745 RepID=A0A9X2GAD9_9ACTN|nr:hypothetical protein [Nonomuraea thailandensis]MCP2354090.1 Zn-dependent protease with chaperone function [Nonomuraea thailandensis]
MKNRDILLCFVGLGILALIVAAFTSASTSGVTFALIGLAFMPAAAVMALVERNDQSHAPAPGPHLRDGRESGHGRP